MDFEVPNTKYMVRGRTARICPECGSSDIVIDEDRCESFCNSCGYVISDYSIEYGRQVSRVRK